LRTSSDERLRDETRRWIDETLAGMRADHQETLALIDELHAEKLLWLKGGRFEDQQKQNSQK
jgi:hypothetical protein